MQDMTPYLIAAIGALFGWIMKIQEDRIKDLKQDVKDSKDLLAKNVAALEDAAKATNDLVGVFRSALPAALQPKRGQARRTTESANS